MAADLVMDIWLRGQDQFSDVFKKLGVEIEGMRGKIGLLAGGFGVLAGGALAESVKQASSFQTTMAQVAGNTNMTTQQMNQASATIKAMASETSAPLEDLARGYEHISNFGYRAADATRILSAAQESATSTGMSVAEVSNMLANVMHEYGLATTHATDAVNVMHTASAMSNMRLNEFVEYGGRAIGMAAGLGIALTDVSAAFSALTLHGEPAARAGTDLTGMINHIVSPAKQAREELQYLSNVTGIDLVHDFSAAGLKAKGLSGVIADVGKATHGNKELIDKLIPAMHGNYAMFQLTNQGAADYRRILSALNDTMAGKTNPTAEAYARTQQTVAFQLGVLKNNLQLMAISIGEAVLPALNKLLGAVVPVVRAIADWTSKHAGLVAGLLAGVAVVGTLIGAILILGPVIAAIASPIGIVVVAIGGAIAAIVALATSSSGVRDFLAGVWSAIADDAGALWQGLTGIWNGISGDAMLLWENLGSWLSQTWTGIVSFAGPIWNGLVNTFKYVWDRITGDKDGAANALKAIPVEWRPLVQAIGDTLAGSWFTVKYIWDNITGNHAAATQDLKNIPPEWRPLVKDIGDVLSGSFMTVKYLWDDITGQHTKATADLKKIPPEWRPIVTEIANVFNKAKTDIGKFWHEVGDTGHRVWQQTVKPTLTGLTQDWNKFLHQLGPLIGPAGENVKRVLTALAAPFAIAMGAVTGALSGAWKGFWSGDGKGGAKALLLDGLHALATFLRNSAHIIYDGILVVFSLVGLNWGAAKTHLGEAIHDWLTLVHDVMTSKDKLVTEAVHAIWGAIEGYFAGAIIGAVKWGETIVENLAIGVKKSGFKFLNALVDLLKKAVPFLKGSSPPPEGPLAFWPDFTYIADGMRLAIPHVQAASRDLAAAAVMEGGTFALDASSSLDGSVAGSASMPALGGRAAGGLVMNNTININGGTFTDKKGVSDLAEKVSEEIMHKVRLQGGLLPQV